MPEVTPSAVLFRYYIALFLSSKSPTSLFANCHRQAVRLPLFRTEVPELVEQYVKAFEKVWAHRSELAKG